MMCAEPSFFVLSFKYDSWMQYRLYL